MARALSGVSPHSVVLLVRRSPAWRYWPVAAAFLAMYVPTFARLATGPWETDQGGGGPFILAAALWLAYSTLKDFDFADAAPKPVAGGCLLLAGLMFYVVGRSQSMLFVEAGSQIPVLMGLVLVFHGARLLRRLWFVFVFMAFLAPLPGWFMDTLTAPLKQAVSALATDWLYALGYPVSQNGVILSIGQYKLLVQDACAGLNSMFSLSAVGLFYIYLARRRSLWRRAVLAVSILPIAFFANLLRVLALLLVTFHFGDAAGQGLIHEFSGVILFAAALASLFVLDGLILAGRHAAARARRIEREAAR